MVIIYQKRRRNNRILSKFYDAKYIDIRDGQIKGGKDLSCGRTNRSESRRSELNQRIYRGEKKSKGRVSIRRKRYSLQPGDVVKYKGKKYKVVGVQNNGKYVKLKGFKVVNIEHVKPIYHVGGWIKIN